MPAYRGKRLFDFLVVIATSPIWLPILGIIAGLVRVFIGSPVFFRQHRAGLSGTPFQVLKFRSMNDARDGRGALLSDEQRLTPFGRWLRATSLDELPELINVIRGDMSLVGPRPLLVQYLPLYSEQHRRRHNVRPGITGLAQVSGRNALTWPERFDLDVWYSEHMSAAVDMKILISTVGAVLGRRGISAAGEATMQPFTGYGPPAPSQSMSEEAR